MVGEVGSVVWLVYVGEADMYLSRPSAPLRISSFYCCCSCWSFLSSANRKSRCALLSSRSQPSCFRQPLPSLACFPAPIVQLASKVPPYLHQKSKPVPQQPPRRPILLSSVLDQETSARLALVSTLQQTTTSVRVMERDTPSLFSRIVCKSR